MRRELLFAVSLSLFLVLPMGCKSKSSSAGSSSSPTAHLRVQVTDDPFPYDVISSVELTISRVEVLPSSSAGPVTLVYTPITVDLASLRNGVMDILADVQITPNIYRWVRLSFSSLTVNLKDGRQFPIPLTVDQQAGFNVEIGPWFNITSAEDNDLLLDLDLSQSLVAQGLPGISGFTFNPVIRAIDKNRSGTYHGFVMSDNGTPANPGDDFPIAGAYVTASWSDGSGVVGTAVTDESGAYAIVGLRPGVYSLTIQAAGHATYNLPPYGTTTINDLIVPFSNADLLRNILLEKN